MMYGACNMKQVKMHVRVNHYNCEQNKSIVKDVKVNEIVTCHFFCRIINRLEYAACR